MLEVKHLKAGYGPIKVLHGLDFDVDEGEIVVILGANGAGKTTTLRALSGMIQRSGNVLLRRRATRRQGAGRHRASRRRPRAPRAGHVPRAQRRGQPQGGRLHPQGQRGPRATWSGGTRPVSRAAGTDGPTRRQPLRWRAADAGASPGDDVRGPTCCCSTNRRSAWRR